MYFHALLLNPAYSIWRICLSGMAYFEDYEHIVEDILDFSF